MKQEAKALMAPGPTSKRSSATSTMGARQIQVPAHRKEMAQ